MDTGSVPAAFLGPKNVTELQRWIVYNVGIDPIRPEQLEFGREAWQSSFNTRWHYSNPNDLQSALHKAIEDHWIGFSENGEIELKEVGEILWSDWFQPNWSKSFEFSRGESSNISDFEIRLIATSYKTIFEVVIADLCIGEYGYVDLTSLNFVENVLFRPLYWKQLTGIATEFDAMHVSKVSYNPKYVFKVLRAIEWHKKL